MESDSRLVVPLIFSIYNDPYFTIDPSEETISVDNFFILINYVTSTEERSFRVDKIIDQSDILSLISNFDKYQLSLFCYHILIINQYQFDLGLQKQLILQLKKYYTPHWELELVPIDKGFRDLFLTEVKFDFNIVTKDILDDLIFLLKHPYYDSLREEIQLGLEFHNWSFDTLSSIIDVLNQIRLGLIWEEYHSIFNELHVSIENLLIGNIILFEDNPSKKTAINFLLLYSYLSQDHEGLISAQDQLDDLWSSVMKYPELVESQRYIFLSFYILITQRFVDDTNSFVIKRNLIQSIMERFDDDILQHNNVINTILNSQSIHPWLMDKIILGFETYSNLLFDYLITLPDSREKLEIRNHLEKISDLNYRQIVDYLVRNYRLTHPGDDVDQFLSGLYNLSLDPEYLNTIHRFLIITNKILLFLKKERMYQEHYQYRLELWLKVLNLSNEAELSSLYEVDILLLTGQYPFLPIFRMIETEVEEEGSILKSKTFEERIVRVITVAMEYLANGYESAIQIHDEAYLILLAFTSDWLQHFSRNDELFNEANGILSAIVIVCLSHLSRSYYRSKKIEQAFLMYLNLYFFSEYLNKRVYTMTQAEDYMGAAETVPQKFLDMIGEWNFKNLIDLDFIGKSANNLILSIKNSIGTNTAPKQSNMLQDDLLFGYLDLTDALHEFLTQDMRALSLEKILNLSQFRVYIQPEPNALTRLERVGSSLVENEIPLPFPFIRSVERFATAMTLVPFDYGSDLINEGMLVNSIIALLNLKESEQ